MVYGQKTTVNAVNLYFTFVNHGYRNHLFQKYKVWLTWKQLFAIAKHSLSDKYSFEICETINNSKQMIIIVYGIKSIFYQQNLLFFQKIYI